MADEKPIKLTGRFKDITSQRFGRLVAVELFGRVKHQRVAWKCQCDCGAIAIITANRLVQGLTKSCGCLQKELTRKRFQTHGHSVNRVISPTYRTWSALKERCLNPKNKFFKEYGGRGIAVCDSWMNSFESFLRDMGPKPTKRHSIDRIDNDKGYSPENCRWATPTQQARNTRRTVKLTLNGVTHTLADWCEILQIPRSTISGRRKRGWSDEDVLTRPLKPDRRRVNQVPPCRTITG